MVVVISPSKKQDFSADNLQKHTHLRQISQTEQLLKILKNLPEGALIDLMKISEKLAKLNHQRFQNFTLPLDLNNAKQAIFAFKGDVYNGIDALTLEASDLEFSQQHLRILSGLYGVVRPLDLIAPYRLEMGTRLTNLMGKNLYEFWGNELSITLNQDKANTLINLASHEYFKAIDIQALDANIINIIFKEKKNNVYKIIGIYAKRARGLMVRFIIRNKITQPLALQKFNAEGYQFRTEMSDETSWVFTRE
jgi:cytoplasmic iron level regulating protein YaaA (DUF328/UPF0246 family)